MSTPKLTRNKRGVLEIHWSENRRSMRKSCRTKNADDAQQQLATFIQQRKNEAQCAAAPLTVGNALRDYLREHVDAGDVVDWKRQHAIAANLLPHLGGKLCRDLSAADVLAYQAARRRGSMTARKANSDGTLRRELNMLVAALNHAVRNKRLPAGDMPYIKLPAPPAPRDFWLTEDEARYMVDYCNLFDDRGALFIRIALATAARRRSIETLTWDQIDLHARLIHFNPPGRQQTKKRRVAVPISDILLDRLVAEKAKATNNFVLGNDQPIARGVEAICQKMARASGNSRYIKVTPHTLRHTWATLAARAGVSMFEIAGVLGDTLATVQANYLHHSPEHLRAAVNFGQKETPA